MHSILCYIICLTIFLVNMLTEDRLLCKKYITGNYNLYNDLEIEQMKNVNFTK